MQSIPLRIKKTAMPIWFSIFHFVNMKITMPNLFFISTTGKNTHKQCHKEAWEFPAVKIYAISIYLRPCLFICLFFLFLFVLPFPDFLRKMWSHTCIGRQLSFLISILHWSQKPTNILFKKNGFLLFVFFFSTFIMIFK